MLGALLVCAPAASAQPTYELRINVDRVYVNEPFTVQLVIENYSRLGPVRFPELRNCAVASNGQSTSSYTTLAGGRLETIRTTTYDYRIRAREVGELLIPPIELEVDGKTVMTQARRLSVLPAAAKPTVATDDQGAPLLRAEITGRETQLFVGQSAQFTLRVWIKPARVGSSVLSGVDMYRFLANSRTGFGPFPEPTTFERTRLRLDDGTDQTYYVYVMRGQAFLKQPGPPDFDGLTIAMDYPTEFGRDIFGQPTARRTTPLRIRPKIVAPEVQPLPAKDRPANFTGAVGNYRVRVQAEPHEVRVGDPIELQIEISGAGPLETLSGPRLDLQQNLAADFRVPDETLAGRTVRGRRIFTQRIRAKHDQIAEIPPIEFPYFDPRQGRYVVARSVPIPIAVRAGEELTAADLPALVQNGTHPSSTELTELDGLRGNRTGESELLATTATITPAHLAAATFAPPAAFLAFWGYTALVRNRNDDTLRRRRQTAFAHAKKRLGRAASLPPVDRDREVEAVFAVYLADRLGEPLARFTGRTAIERLRETGVSAETVTHCAGLIDRCERGAYAGAEDGQANLIEQARDCLARLERERL